MLTTRWSPAHMNLWNTLNRQVNCLWNDLTAAPAAGPVFSGAYPALNLWEDEENLYAEAEMPGLSIDDLEIYVTGGNQLTLQGERKPHESKATWHRRERGFGKFGRVI